MTIKEREEFIRSLKEYAKEMTSSKQKSIDFLKRIGVLTPTGKLSKHYKILKKV